MDVEQSGTESGNETHTLFDLHEIEMPSTNVTTIDVEFLAKLYRESGINIMKNNAIKKEMWKEIAFKYCVGKSLPPMDHKILSRKWSKLVMSAKKKRLPNYLNSLSEIVLDAAEANTDPHSGLDNESDDGIDQGKSSAPQADPLSEVVLDTAESNADLDNESDERIDQGKLYFMT